MPCDSGWSAVLGTTTDNDNNACMAHVQWRGVAYAYAYARLGGGGMACLQRSKGVNRDNNNHWQLHTYISNCKDINTAPAMQTSWTV